MSKKRVHRIWRLLAVILLVFFAIGLHLILTSSGSYTNPMLHNATLKQVTELKVAIMTYYSEYKQFPTGFGRTLESGDELVLTTACDPLISILVADPEFERLEEWNPRRISFMSVPESRRHRLCGATRDSTSGLLALNDSWGRPFRIILDANSDGEIPIPEALQTLTARKPTQLLCWSLGPDGVEGKGHYDPSDDIGSTVEVWSE